MQEHSRHKALAVTSGKTGGCVEAALGLSLTHHMDALLLLLYVHVCVFVFVCLGLCARRQWSKQS